MKNVFKSLMLVLVVTFSAVPMNAGCDWRCAKYVDYVTCSYRYDVPNRGTMTDCDVRTWCDGSYCQDYCYGGQCYLV